MPGPPHPDLGDQDRDPDGLGPQGVPDGGTRGARRGLTAHAERSAHHLRPDCPPRQPGAAWVGNPIAAGCGCRSALSVAGRPEAAGGARGQRSAGPDRQLRQLPGALGRSPAHRFHRPRDRQCPLGQQAGDGAHRAILRAARGRAAAAWRAALPAAAHVGCDGGAGARSGRHRELEVRRQRGSRRVRSCAEEPHAVPDPDRFRRRARPSSPIARAAATCLGIRLDRVAISSLGEQTPVQLLAEGAYNDVPAQLDATTESYAVLRDDAVPFGTRFTLAGPDTDIAFDGTMQEPLDFEGVRGELSDRGPHPRRPHRRDGRQGQGRPAADDRRHPGAQRRSLVARRRQGTTAAIGFLRRAGADRRQAETAR